MLRSLVLYLTAFVSCLYAAVTHSATQVAGYKVSDNEVLMEFDECILATITFSEILDTDKFINLLLTDGEDITEFECVFEFEGMGDKYHDLAARLCAIDFGDSRGASWTLMKKNQLRVIRSHGHDQYPEFDKSQDYLISSPLYYADCTIQPDTETSIHLSAHDWQHVHVPSVPLTFTPPFMITAFLYQVPFVMAKDLLFVDLPQLKQNIPAVFDTENATLTFSLLSDRNVVLARLAMFPLLTHPVAADVPSVYENIQDRSNNVNEFLETNSRKVDVAGVYCFGPQHVILALDSERLRIVFARTIDARRFLSAVAGTYNRVQDFFIVSLEKYNEALWEPVDLSDFSDGICWADGLGSSWEILLREYDNLVVMSLRSIATRNETLSPLVSLRVKDISLTRGSKPSTATIKPSRDNSKWRQLADYPLTQTELENRAPSAVFYQQCQMRIFEKSFFAQHRPDIMKLAVYDLNGYGCLYITPVSVVALGGSIFVTFTVRFVKAHHLLYQVSEVSDAFISPSDY